MHLRTTVARGLLMAAGCAVAIHVAGTSAVMATSPAATQAQTGRGAAPGGGVTSDLFTLVDANKDGAAHARGVEERLRRLVHEVGRGARPTRSRLEQVFLRLRRVAAGSARRRRAGGSAQNQTPRPDDVAAMMAALPDKAPAKPKQPRRILVLGEGGGVRPLVDSARRPHHRRNRQEDGRVVDDHHLRRGGHQRRQPEAVRRDLPGEHDRRVPRRSRRPGGDRGAAQGAARLRARRQGPGGDPCRDRLLPSRARRRRAGGRGGGADQLRDPAGRDADVAADKNNDGRLTPRGVHRARRQLVRQARQRQDRPGRARRFPAALRRAAACRHGGPGAGGGNGQAPATNLGPDTEVGTWPEFNKMIGGFFKFHWNDGQPITVKIDDPKQPAERRCSRARSS